MTAVDLEDRLTALLNPVLSSRRTAAPLAQALIPLKQAQQNFTLRWVEVIARTNYELAYQFAAAAPEALKLLDSESAEVWIVHAMDNYDRAGLYQGTEAFRNFASFIVQAGQEHVVHYEEVATVLQHFLCGLSGRRMKIDMAPVAWTDTATLFLPPRMAAGTSRSQNFLIYKIITTLLWAQCRYDTFGVDITAVVNAHANPAQALEWLNFLESVRLEARMAITLPGLARELVALRGDAPDYSSDRHYAALRAPDATVQHSIALLGTLPLTGNPPRHAWTGALRPAEATVIRARRLSMDKSDLQAALAALLADQTQSDNDADNEARNATGFEAQITSTVDGEIEYELLLDGKPITAPDHVRNLLESIAQDLGEIPTDYLSPSDARDNTPDGDDQNDAPLDGPALFYDEWDYQRRHFRKNWCALRERDGAEGDCDFVNATLKKYAPQVRQLKRSFEMLRGEDRLHKRMKHGDDIDLDAFIAGYADMRSGVELPERLFTKCHKAERNLAVMFMVDMSGSTKGWINDAEREALVLLAEALEVLGDRYAIYGFSGMTRKRCEIFRIKRFDEPYSEIVRRRIAGVLPQDYTRMGVAIRHLTALFESIDARTKLLITLSDGKPDDYSDNYRGEYGVEDTRKALLEAQRAGIKPFCITIDHEARDYLPHMYGAVNWTLVDEVSHLPLKVAEIYRRLTA